MDSKVKIEAYREEVNGESEDYTKEGRKLCRFHFEILIYWICKQLPRQFAVSESLYNYIESLMS